MDSRNHGDRFPVDSGAHADCCQGHDQRAGGNLCSGNFIGSRESGNSHRAGCATVLHAALVCNTCCRRRLDTGDRADRGGNFRFDKIFLVGRYRYCRKNANDRYDDH